MATLKYIREAKDSHLLLLGVAEEGESARYTVNSSDFAEIGSPSVGDELDLDQLSVIKSADQICRAKKKALSLLAYADNNERTLKIKLCRAGFSNEIAADVCSEMVSLGYINEKRQLERLVLNEANVKLRGPGRIIPALVSKGYSSADVREIMLNLVESGEIDFSKNARTLLSKKLTDENDSDEKKKLLFKNGYKI